MRRSMRSIRVGSRCWRSTVIACWLLAPPGPALARVVDLDVVPGASRVTIEATSGIYFDRPPQNGGTVFIPFAIQSGAGVGGPTNGLRADLAGRIRVDFRPGDATPTLAIRGFSTLFAPVASGTWRPGLPGSPATPAAAQAAVTIGSVGAFATGQAALRDLALTIDASHPLVAAGANAWQWPDGPFDGATPDRVELRVADGAIDFGLSITALTRQFVSEGSLARLVLSASNRVRVIASGVDDLELRMPLDVAIEKSLVEPVSSLPVRVRLDLDGVLVARNFVPEPDAAAVTLAAFCALALLARRRRTRRLARPVRGLMQIALLALLVGVACQQTPGFCQNDEECPEPEQCVENVCLSDGSCADPTDCANGEFCSDGDCEALAAPDATCVGDGDCQSFGCTNGVCDGCGGDRDCDGISDGADGCPTTPGDDPNGCDATIEVGGGVTLFCANAANCIQIPSGGTCTACSIRDGSLVLDCFAPGASCTTFESRSSCSDGCRVKKADGTDLLCGNDCSEVSNPVGGVSCSGSCDGSVGGFGTLNCDDCNVFVDPRSGPKGRLVLRKQSTGGDGSFPFEVGDINLGGNGGFDETITTSAGVGNVAVQVIAPIGSLFAHELSTPGFELESMTCDGPNEIVDSVLEVTPAPGGTVSCLVSNASSSTGGVIPAGGVTDPDAVSRTRTFGLPPGNRIAVAGSNGLVILDALTGTIPSVGNTNLSFLGPFDRKNLLGALVIERPTGNGADAIFTYANTSGASIQTYVPENLDFGATLLLNGTYRDAVHLGNDPEQTGAILTTTTSVQRFVWTDFGGGQLFPNTAIALNNFTGAGTPISAFAFPSLTHIALVTSGTPGKLALGNPAQSFQAVTVVGDVGNDPRRIRCHDTVCAVSNFGSDSLTLASWDGAANLAITGTQPVGDGPIGIDLITLEGGNLAIASTGFNDATYSITVTSPSGAVLASSTLPVPDGCVQPGHALWLDDAEQHLVISCFGSDNLAVFVPAIPAP